MCNDNMVNEENAIDDIDEILNERFRDVAREEYKFNKGLNEDAKKFFNLLEEANQELYLGCKNLFSLPLRLNQFIIYWSIRVAKKLSFLNIINSFNETRCMIKDLRLDCKKIDVCPNDYMFYWKDNENDTFCHVSKTP